MIMRFYAFVIFLLFGARLAVCAALDPAALLLPGPTGLSVSAINADSCTLSWAAPVSVSSIRGYQLMSGRTILARVAVPASTFKITRLKPDSVYSLTVSSFSDNQTSQPSAPITVRTLAVPKAPTPPAMRITLTVPTTSWLITQGAEPRTEDKTPFAVKILWATPEGKTTTEVPAEVMFTSDLNITVQNLPRGLTFFWAPGDREVSIGGRPLKSGKWETVFSASHRGQVFSSTVAIEVKPPTFEWCNDPEFRKDDMIGGVVLGANGEPVSFSEIFVRFKRLEGTNLLASHIHMSPAEEVMDYTDKFGIVKVQLQAGPDDGKPTGMTKTSADIICDFGAFYSEAELRAMANTEDWESRMLRGWAIEALLWDETKIFPDTMQRALFRQHQELIPSLFAARRITKPELEALLKETSNFKGEPIVDYNRLYFRRLAAVALKSAFYAPESPTDSAPSK